MILHLGVVDVSYSQAAGPRAKPRAGTITTGDVAEILERRYHVMEVFFNENAATIARALEESVAGALESFIMGAPVRNDQFGAGTARIEERFRDFLSNKEMERLGYPGVPTRAALAGVSHRRKRPRGARAPRPSFVDTSLYMSSFKAWIE